MRQAFVNHLALSFTINLLVILAYFKLYWRHITPTPLPLSNEKKKKKLDIYNIVSAYVPAVKQNEWRGFIAAWHAMIFIQRLFDENSDCSLSSRIEAHIYALCILLTECYYFANQVYGYYSW